MSYNNNPVNFLKDLAVNNLGLVEQKGSKLTMIFSREICTDSALRTMVSELCSSGILHGENAVLSPTFLDELTQSDTFDLAKNVSLKLGASPSDVIIEVQTLGLAE